MMEQNMIMWLWIVGAAFVLMRGITFYLLTQKDKRQEKCIESLKEKVRLLELRLQHLEDKLWSEDKLTKVIVDAVASSMTMWENKMLKNGFIHNHKRGDLGGK